MASFSLSSKLGDDRTVTITATWPVAVPELGVLKGDPFDLETVQEIWFTGKRSAADDDHVFQKMLSNGHMTVNGNKATVDLFALDMSEQVAANATIQLVCDVQVRTADGKNWTVAEGKWKFTQELTEEV